MPPHRPLSLVLQHPLGRGFSSPRRFAPRAAELLVILQCGPAAALRIFRECYLVVQSLSQIDSSSQVVRCCLAIGGAVVFQANLEMSERCASVWRIGKRKLALGRRSHATSAPEEVVVGGC